MSDVDSENLAEKPEQENEISEEQADKENVNVEYTVISDTITDDTQTASKKSGESANANPVPKQCQLPFARVKNIMKLDSDLALASKESVFLVVKATELFIEFFAKESYKYTNQGSRKTIQKKDIDQAINNVDSLCFLDGALD